MRRRVAVNAVQNSEYKKYKGLYYVDLGLPSGNLWAAYDFGSKDKMTPGKYYYAAGGEYEIKDNYPTRTVSYTRDNSYYYIWDPSSDPVYNKTNGIWHTPTYGEFNELCNGITCVDQIYNYDLKIYVYEFKSKYNGAIIYFPQDNPYASGKPHTSIYGSRWVTRLKESYSGEINSSWSFTADGSANNYRVSTFGLCIRPVTSPQ